MDAEQRRLALSRRLAEVLGDQEAATLMENLPPIPWDRLATKEDVRALAADVDMKLQAQTYRFDGKLDATKGELALEMSRNTRTIVFTTLFSTTAAVLTAAGLAFAAASGIAIP